MKTVEERERIRRAYYIEGKSMRQIAGEWRHSYWTIRKALTAASVPPYTLRVAKPAPVFGAYKIQVEVLLAESEQQPRKQRYTSHKIYELIRQAGYAAFKGVPMPGAAVIVGGILLISGDASMLTGYRPVSMLAALVLFLLPVTMLMHNFWAVTDVQMHVIEQGLWMRNMALAGATFFLLTVPRPWFWSVDELMAPVNTSKRVQPAGR